MLAPLVGLVCPALNQMAVEMGVCSHLELRWEAAAQSAAGQMPSVVDLVEARLALILAESRREPLHKGWVLAVRNWSKDEALALAVAWDHVPALLAGRD